ncbi:MAG: hypothetical protein HAW63_01810 [Bdellovibrionaceae bacterium]|nr:hypothetical protein [Pseudobdellovibrionaceae bacterium]
MQDKRPLLISILITIFLNPLAYGGGKSSVKLNRKTIHLSKFSKTQIATKSKIQLKDIRPPVSRQFSFPPGTDLQELETVTDESIKYLFNLAKRYKADRDRADIWLRLAKQYFEKSKLVKLKLHERYHKKRRHRKRINFNSSYVYNKKSLKLYLWFLKTFPNEKRSEKVYSFAIKNYLLFDQVKKAAALYTTFSKKYSSSLLKEELNFLIADYYFSKFFWKQAKKFYKQGLKSRTKRLKYLIYYKLAWVNHKMGKYKTAFSYLTLVLKNTQSGKLFSFKKIAIRDLPYFYSRYGSGSSAKKMFSRYMSNKQMKKSLGLLASYYLSDGRRSDAVYIWRQLISMNPMEEGSFEYAYKIIQSYKYSQIVTKNILLIKRWLSNYGLNSQWLNRDYKNRKKYVQKQEEYLRYLIATFYNKKATKNKAKRMRSLLSLYPLYLKSFSNQKWNKKKLLEIKFLYADLLFDKKKYAKAQGQYNEIVSFGQSSFYKKALYNKVLCSEKRILSYNQVKKRTRNFSKILPISGVEKLFEASALHYLSSYADLNLEYRLGYFYYNRLQLALADKTLNSYLNHAAKSKRNKVARKQVISWLVDIYSKQKKYEKIKTLFEANTAVARSKKFQHQKDKVYFKVAENLEKQKKYLKAIKEYEKIDLKKSSLATPALFNRANLYLKIKDISKAAFFLQKIKFSKNKTLYKKAKLSLVSIYREKGLYVKVAQALESMAKNKFRESATWYYNAGILRKSLKQYKSAINDFNKFLLLSKNVRKKRKVKLLLVDLYIATNQVSKSITLLKKYYRTSTSSKEKYFIGDKIIGLYKRLNKPSKAGWWQKKLFSSYVKNRRTFNKYPRILQVVAKIKYTYAKQAFSKLLQLKFNKKLKLQTLTKQKLALLEKVQKEAKAVASLNNSDYLLKVLVLEARAESHVANFFTSLPVPKSLKGDDKKAYIKGVKKFTDPMLLRGKKLYELTLEKAYDFKIYNTTVVFAYNQIASQEDSVKKPYISYFERLKVNFTTSGQFLYKGKYKQKFTTFIAMKKFALSGIANENGNQDYWYILSASYIGRGFLDLADIILEDKGLLKANASAYYNDKAVLALKRGEISEGVAFLEKISKNTLLQNSYAGINLAFVYASYSEFAKAKGIFDYFNKKSYAFSIMDLNNYAIVAELLKKFNKAKKLYKKALTIDAEYSLGLFNYGYFLFQTNQKGADISSLLERAKVWNNDKRLLKLIKLLNNRVGRTI